MKRNKNPYILLWLFLSYIIFTLILAAVLFCRFLFSDSITEEYSTIDVANYGVWDGHIECERDEINSKLAIFPNATENAEDADYYYYCSKGNFNNHYVIYAEMEYTDEEYQKELQRLSEIEVEIELPSTQEVVSNGIVFDEKSFRYPAYVAIYGCNLSYEYALADEENHKIIYVYSRLQDLNGMIPDKYLPLEAIGKDMYENNSWDNINIYYCKYNKVNCSCKKKRNINYEICRCYK